jgi:fatty acid desaturase
VLRKLSFKNHARVYPDDWHRHCSCIWQAGSKGTEKLKIKKWDAQKEKAIMLWTILVVLLVLWLIGAIGGIGGNLIHLLLVVALIVLVINLLTGRRTV